MGCYQFSPLQSITKKNGQVIHLWSSCDALVLELITLHLSSILPVSKLCTHVKEHGGLKSTVNQVHRQRDNYQYVIRTDVKAYYASIDHHLAINSLSIYIKDKTLLNMLWQYMNRSVERGGLFKEISLGISRGCPLSPLIGAFFLYKLDEGFEREGLFYVRYMDDILILTKTRWKCRGAVKQLNNEFNRMKIVKHPDKTFIGKIEKGFDFLGYHFSTKGLTIAEITWSKFVARLHRLYEQKKASVDCDALLGEYVCRWQRWTRAGLIEKNAVTIQHPTNITPHIGGVCHAAILSSLTARFSSCHPDQAKES